MASRYWVGGGSSVNWNATGNTNWSATSGGAGNASVPGSSDDVFFDGAGASGNSNSTISATITILSLTISAGYTSTMTHNAIITNTSNWTMHSGYTIAGSSGITLSTTTATQIASGGKTWPNAILFLNNKTVTLNGDLTVAGLITQNNVLTMNVTTAEKLYAGGGYALNGELKGTVVVDLTGGTFSGVDTAGHSMSVSYRFAGNVTVTGHIRHSVNNTITYVSGTVSAAGSTIDFTSTGTYTLNTAGMTFGTILSKNSHTLTLNSTLNAVTLTCVLNTIFAGTAGFNVGTLSSSATVATTISLKEAITYTVTSALTCNTSRNADSLIISSGHVSTKAILTLSYGATCAVLANITRIDASGGRPIRTFNGVVTDCINVEEFHDLLTVAA